MRFRFRLLSGALAAIFLAACSRPPQTTAQVAQAAASGPPAPGDWVVQVVGADPESLNPITDTDAIGAVVTGQIFEGLLQMDNHTLKLEPCLASTYEISPDQLTYTFHLRLRRIAFLLSEYQLNEAALRHFASLLDEVERLREEVRFLRG